MQVFTPELWQFVCLIFGREDYYILFLFNPLKTIVEIALCDKPVFI